MARTHRDVYIQVRASLNPTCFHQFHIVFSLYNAWYEIYTTFSSFHFASVRVKMHYLPQPTMSKLQDSQYAISIQAPKACRKFSGNDTYIHNGKCKGRWHVFHFLNQYGHLNLRVQWTKNLCSQKVETKCWHCMIYVHTFWTFHDTNKWEEPPT